MQVLRGTTIKSVKDRSLLTSDVFLVNCSAADGSTYSNVHAAVVPTQQVRCFCCCTSISVMRRTSLYDDTPHGREWTRRFRVLRNAHCRRIQSLSHDSATCVLYVTLHCKNRRNICEIQRDKVAEKRRVFGLRSKVQCWKIRAVRMADWSQFWDPVKIAS